MLDEISVNLKKRPNFFSWFYGQGLHQLLEIWKNYLFFVFYFFSIKEMFVTLISPWRRDVTIHDWRGWQPGKQLELIVSNLLSRFVGAVVRLFVIIGGLLVVAFFFVIGLAFVFAWVGAPFLFIAIFYLVTMGILQVYFGVAIASLLLILFVCSYLASTNIPLIFLDHEALIKHPVFDRICGRLGIDRKKFPVAIFQQADQFAEFLKIHGLTMEDFNQILKYEIICAQKKVDKAKFWTWENLKKNIPIGLQWRFAYTVNLDKYCSELSDFDSSDYCDSDLIGRQDEYEILKLLLQRPDQNCALVVGNSGIGKKTLIHALAKNIRQGEENSYLRTTRVMLLDLGRAISDTINRGEDVENFLRILFYEACFAGNIVLIVEHIEHFLGKESNTFHPDISSVLSEFLSVPNFQIIATSTLKEYHQLIEKREQIVKYFEVVEMREPSEEDSVSILLNKMEKYETKRILFTYKSLKDIVTVSGNHNWDFPLPERAIDLAMDVLMFWEKRSNDQFITDQTVNEYLSLKTGVKHGAIEGEERKKLLNLEELLHAQVIGQTEAIRQVSEALRRARTGISNSQKPIGSFLFLGPTGVGKTETAKALAKTYFGDEARMIRLDMSEFQTPSSIDRLLGSSHLNQPGVLVTKIKDNPYSLLLLDEIEKAYPDILDIFLQILDEGFVTDAFGEKVNFRNTLIIATSNAGAALIKKMVEENADPADIQQAVVDWAIENNIFRTEFLNRFEGVIFFRPLNENELVAVIKLQLQKFARKLAKEKNINISFGEEIISRIIEKGYNPIFGARSVNRFIEDEVEGIVAKKIIEGELQPGGGIEISL